MPPRSSSHTFDVLRAIENNRTTARRGALPWKCIRPRSPEKLSVNFRITPRCHSIQNHDYRPAPHMKHNSCLFYSHGWLKMVVCMEEQPLPPSSPPPPPLLAAPTCSYRDDTLYWNMRNPANTVAMTTQPEDNCFTAHNTTHHLQKYVAPLSALRGSLWWSDQWNRGLLPPVWKKKTLMNQSVVGCE